MRIASLSAALLLSLSAMAQKKKEAVEAPAFSPSAGIILTTTGVYDAIGTDTSIVNQLSLAPFAELRHRSGLGIIYRPYLVVGGKHGGVLMQQLTASYERYDLPSWNVDVSYTHTFFSKDPNFPVSPLTNAIYAMGSYTKPWLAPTLSLAFGFGKDASGSTSDLAASAGVHHDFSGESAAKKISWDFSPAFSVNGATNNNYSYLQNAEYISQNGKLGKSLNQNQQARKHRNTPAGTTTTATTEVSQKGFALNNIELGFWSSLAREHFELNPMASIYFPLDGNGTTVSTYWQLLLRYKF
jgi:hypothetical protein